MGGTSSTPAAPAPAPAPAPSPSPSDNAGILPSTPFTASPSPSDSPVTATLTIPSLPPPPPPPLHHDVVANPTPIPSPVPTPVPTSTTQPAPAPASRANSLLQRLHLKKTTPAPTPQPTHSTIVAAPTATVTAVGNDSNQVTSTSSTMIPTSTSTSTFASTSPSTIPSSPTTVISTPAVPASSGFKAQLMDNPLFTGGLGIAALTVGLSVAKQAVLQALVLAQKHLTVSLEIPSKDRSYPWVLQWISRHSAQRQQHMGLDTQFKQQQSTGQVSVSFDFVPATGQHWIVYNRKLIQVQRDRDKNVVDIHTGSPWETVTLRTVGRSRAAFESILQEAKQQALRREEGKTVIYTSYGPEWKQFGQPKKRRPMHSVVLDQGVAEHILADFREFTSSQQWYVDRGIPYRRGYLLHGPPGCGKSSFIMALAGELQYNICILNLNERGLTDDKLNVLLSVVPPRSIVLLEDVDAAFHQRDKVSLSWSITFSGLLNALDGVASTEERVIFMTTNHLERLDPALVRPGRVDVIEHIGLTSPEQARIMFLRFYPQETALATKFTDKFKSLQYEYRSRTPPLSLPTFSTTPSATSESASFSVSVAQLQGFLLTHKTSPHQALLRLPHLFQQAYAASNLQQQQQQQQQQPTTSTSTQSTEQQLHLELEERSNLN